MALCTQAQVEQRLQISFTNDPEAVITELIAAATGHIERITERAIESAAYTEVFDPPDGKDIWLTNVPVNTLTSTTVDGTALTTTSDLTLDADIGRLSRTSNDHRTSWGTSKLQSISVTYNGGYSTVPTDIQDICARMVARAFQAGASYAALPASADGVKQVSLAGSDSVTYTDTVSDVTMSAFITPEEVDALSYYRNAVLA